MSIDLSARVERTHGIARVQRAVFLANARPELRHAALATAVVEVKKGARVETSRWVSARIWEFESAFVISFDLKHLYLPC